MERKQGHRLTLRRIGATLGTHTTAPATVLWHHLTYLSLPGTCGPKSSNRHVVAASCGVCYSQRGSSGSSYHASGVLYYVVTIYCHVVCTTCTEEDVSNAHAPLACPLPTHISATTTQEQQRVKFESKCGHHCCRRLTSCTSRCS